MPTELRSADLLVTTPFHTADAKRLASRIQKPWITIVLRVDYVAEVTRLLALGPVYFVVADARFADKLRAIYRDVAGATNLRPLVVGRDDLAHIPADAATYVTRAARDLLGSDTLASRVVVAERMFSRQTAYDLVAFVLRENMAALAAERNPESRAALSTDDMPTDLTDYPQVANLARRDGMSGKGALAATYNMQGVSMGTPLIQRAQENPRRSPRYAAGIAASLVAEAVFVTTMMGIMKLRGKDPWKVTRASASLVFGPAVAQPPGFVPGDVARGLSMHVTYSVTVGGLYAALLPQLRLTPIQGGLVTGSVLYALGSYILPATLGGRVEPMKKSPKEKAMAAVMHAFYGVVFGLAYGQLTKRRRA